MTFLGHRDFQHVLRHRVGGEASEDPQEHRDLLLLVQQREAGQGQSLLWLQLYLQLYGFIEMIRQIGLENRLLN